MNAFAEAIREESTVTCTENGDKTYSTTRSACLDLFALGGSLRTRSEEDILDLWKNAVREDQVLAFKILFYIRSVREGYGERRTFRIIWDSLDTLAKFFFYDLVPQIGRWDDLEDTILKFPNVAGYVRGLLKGQYLLALAGEPIDDLLAKWLPCGRGNKTAKIRTKKMAKALCMSEKEYRSVVTTVRRSIGLVEQKMAKNQWKEIDYGKLPSLAGKKYRKAFCRHDEEGYNAFIQEVLAGKKTMNASVLSPVEVIHEVSHGSFESCQAMWNSLPDFINQSTNSLAMVDVSGSMLCRIGKDSSMTAVEAAIAMGLYLAEHNKGVFKDQLISFSSRPTFFSLEDIQGLAKRYLKVKSIGGTSTNLRLAMKAICDLGKKNNVPQEEMPEVLYIFTDGEFDRGLVDDCESFSSTYEDTKSMFREAGYQTPVIVFWNLNGRLNHLPVQKSEIGTVLLSGYSPRMFSLAMSREFYPADVMNNALKEFSFSEEIEDRVKQLTD